MRKLNKAAENKEQRVEPSQRDAALLTRVYTSQVSSSKTHRTMRALVLFLFAAIAAGEEDVVDATVEDEVEEESKVTVLTDLTFEHLTQVTTGATTGDWLVSFCISDCPEDLEELAKQLAEKESYVNVATVDAEENLALAQRFHVVDETLIALFSKGRMWTFHDEKPNLETLTSFVEAERVDGVKIPRKAGPLKRVHEILSDFFDVVDYQFLSGALCAFAVLLVLVGAFAPHPEDPSASKKEEDDDKKKDD